jgi:hypothetical protein
MVKGDTIQLQWTTADEARIHKANITHMQKRLRLLKKNMSVTVRLDNAAFQSEKTKVGKGFGAGFFAGLFGKKAAGRSNALMRDNLRRRQLQTVCPYEGVSRMIDGWLVQLDQAKIQLDTWVLQNK